MSNYYTDEKNTQIILYLLKEFGIRKIIISPGTTNMSLVASVQNDPYFELFSCVDERSAAYMACGLASEANEPVVLSCTGATASRNYLSGLTEAFYRKLPVLAITSGPALSKVGHNFAQVIDRSVMPKDTIKMSVTLPIVKDDDDIWDCEIKVNKALNTLTRNGGGPVHINLITSHSLSYTTKSLPECRKIERITYEDEFPQIPSGKIGIFIGSHLKMSAELIRTIDDFCFTNGAVVFCDHTSNYDGKYKVQYSLVACQNQMDDTNSSPELMIHIGEITGDYYSLSITGKEVWRVNQDGEIRDTYHKLKFVFEMSESYFFKKYTKNGVTANSNYLDECKLQLSQLRESIPELPFCNIWLASQMAHCIPDKSVIHFGILNSLRAWNFFELPSSVTCASNVGGFGIDGGLSALIGASFFDKKKLYFGVIGDLAFFYDMNSLGNRHLGNNLRLLVVNNGKGTEFRNFSHPASNFGEEADRFMAAAGHFGNKSQDLIKDYSRNLGFHYISANSKEDFDKEYTQFISPEISDKPILFEVFTESSDESIALDLVQNMKRDFKGKAKKMAREMLGKKGLGAIKRIIK